MIWFQPFRVLLTNDSIQCIGISPRTKKYKQMPGNFQGISVRALLGLTDVINKARMNRVRIFQSAQFIE